METFVLTYTTGVYDTRHVLPIEWSSLDDLCLDLIVAKVKYDNNRVELSKLERALLHYRLSGRSTFPDFDLEDTHAKIGELIYATCGIKIGKYVLPWDVDNETDNIDIKTLDVWLKSAAPIGD